VEEAEEAEGAEEVQKSDLIFNYVDLVSNSPNCEEIYKFSRNVSAEWL
jgi:hypothetical protein